MSVTSAAGCRAASRCTEHRCPGTPSTRSPSARRRAIGLRYRSSSSATRTSSSSAELACSRCHALVGQQVLGPRTDAGPASPSGSHPRSRIRTSVGRAIPRSRRLLRDQHRVHRRHRHPHPVADLAQHIDHRLRQLELRAVGTHQDKQCTLRALTKAPRGIWRARFVLRSGAPEGIRTPGLLIRRRPGSDSLSGDSQSLSSLNSRVAELTLSSSRSSLVAAARLATLV